MAVNKNQHYVPQFYLKNFSVNEKQIGLYNVPSSRYVEFGKIKDESSEDYFYGKESLIDRDLKNIEDNVAPIIKEIISTNQSPRWDSAEHFHITFFTLSLLGRTKYAKDKHNEKIEKIYKTIISEHPSFINGFTEKDLDLVKINDKNASPISITNAVLSAPILFDLSFKLLLNQTNVSFWTSDNPAVLYNQLFQKTRPHITNTGLGMKGLQIFLPFSPKHLFIFYDNTAYKLGNKNEEIINITQSCDIEEINKLQFINADRNIYFDPSFTEEYIQSFAQKFVGFRKPIRANVQKQFLNSKNSRRFLIGISDKDVKCNLNLGFVKELRKAQKYKFSGKLVIPRSGKTLELLKYAESTEKQLKEKFEKQNLESI